MAEKKITDLDALTAAASDDYLEIVDTSENASKKISHFNLIGSGKAADSDKLDGKDSTEFGRPVFLISAKTSTAWQGKVCSTTAKTKIDLSDVFAVPAGVKAVLASANIKDSGSVAADAWLVLSPVDIAYDGVWVTCSGIANNKLVASGTIIVPCDSNGDIYYQTKASGTNTLTVDLAIYGWWL